MRYLITGHTGFKGSWLSALLSIMGHEVHGISLPPENSSNYNYSKISSYMNSEHHCDIRNRNKLTEIVAKIEPEIIIHLAAQPIVSISYSDPINTYETNVLGTLNLLESTRRLNNLKAALIITTDKVYKNTNKIQGYVETDPLGGDDPYSSSKAAADIATQSWRLSYGTYPISIARAGNVIGGGDYSKFRIVPDVIAAAQNGTFLQLRNPKSIRPWQHVLDCLNGYLKLIEFQEINNDNSEWNFGPSPLEQKSVEELSKLLLSNLGSTAQVIEVTSEYKETSNLTLNSNKSRKFLDWKEKLTFENNLMWVADWYLAKDKRLITRKQIEKFLEK